MFITSAPGTAPVDAVYVGRGSPWGNPFKIGQHGDRDAVCDRFEREVLPTLDLAPRRTLCAPPRGATLTRFYAKPTKKTYLKEGNVLTAENVPAGAVIFTHIDEVTQTQTVFSVTHLWMAVRAAVAAGKLGPTRIRVDTEFAKWCRVHRGVERHRLNRIKAKDLHEPILMLQQPGDSTMLLVDGHHRYVKAANLVKRTIPAFLLPQEIWELCIVTGLPTTSPEDLMRMRSGIN